MDEFAITKERAILLKNKKKIIRRKGKEVFTIFSFEV